MGNRYSYITTGQLSNSENFRHTYFLTDGPYLNVASAPRAVPPFTQPPIRGASQGLWVAWSCLISSVSAIIFSLNWYFLKMVGCMEFCRFGHVWLLVHEQTPGLHLAGMLWEWCCVSAILALQMHVVSVGPIVGHGNSDTLPPLQGAPCLCAI